MKWEAVQGEAAFKAAFTARVVQMQVIRQPTLTPA